MTFLHPLTSLVKIQFLLPFHSTGQTMFDSYLVNEINPYILLPTWLLCPKDRDFIYLPATIIIGNIGNKKKEFSH